MPAPEVTSPFGHDLVSGRVPESNQLAPERHETACGNGDPSQGEHTAHEIYP